MVGSFMISAGIVDLMKKGLRPAVLLQLRFANPPESST